MHFFKLGQSLQAPTKRSRLKQGGSWKRLHFLKQCLHSCKWIQEVISLKELEGFNFLFLLISFATVEGLLLINLAISDLWSPWEIPCSMVILFYKERCFPSYTCLLSINNLISLETLTKLIILGRIKSYNILM